nr:MAG TPA: hypothetical protein [Caudoviricetes sp.]
MVVKGGNTCGSVRTTYRNTTDKDRSVSVNEEIYRSKSITTKAFVNCTF